MKKRFRVGKRDGEAEGFVWVTFSDLLTTLFLVFMVIALWAISSKDSIAKKTELERIEGNKCLNDVKSTLDSDRLRRNALENVSHQMTVEFEILKRDGICNDAMMEEVSGTGGFRIFQKIGLKPWFEDGKSELSGTARVCLKSIGWVWLNLLNSDNLLTSSLQNILVEGHANSNHYGELSEEDDFLSNLGLSQERALSATRFLIEEIKSPIRKGN
ncbi:MAG: hypothetical protein EOP04_31160, partial [Proteobacteria bacterium]